MSIPITLVFKANTGFDLGCFVWEWYRWGPFVVYKEMLSSEGMPPPTSGWKLAVFFTRRAWVEFWEGSSK